MTTELMDKATELFWRKGYQAAGMRDIQAALDMRPGSIYARFKNKQNLFDRVIAHYVEASLVQLEQIIAHPEPKMALRQFLVDTATAKDSDRFRRQCLLVKSIAEFDNLAPGSQEAVKVGMQAMAGAFTRLVERLIADGHCPADCEAPQRGLWLQNQFVALRLTAVTASQDEQLIGQIDKLLADLCAPW